MYKKIIIPGLLSLALVAGPTLALAQNNGNEGSTKAAHRVCLPILKQITSKANANSASAAARTRIVIKNHCDAATDYLKAVSRVGVAPLTVTFTATVPANEAAGSTYVVDFGDNSTVAVSATPGTYTLSHTYTQNGSYKAELVATNGSTETVLGKAKVFVGPIAAVKAPVLSKVVAPAYVKAGHQGTWKVGDRVASGSTTFSVAWGDGTASTGNASSTANMGVFTHTYANPGTYTPTFTATNAAGSTSVSYPVIVLAAKVR